MTSITDYIVIILLFYFFIRGWTKGFLETLLGPISLMIGCTIGIAFFYITRNLPISFLIGILGPFVIKLSFSSILKIWHKTISKDETLPASSKMLGGCLSFLWSGTFLVLILVLVTIAPVHFTFFENIRDNIVQSRSYILINQLAGDKISTASGKITQLTEIFQNPSKLKRLKSTKEFKALINDEKLKDILSDKEITLQIKNKEFAKLLSNGKFHALLYDKDLWKKYIEFNKIILEQD